MPTQRKIFWTIGLLLGALLCLGWLIARNKSVAEKQHPFTQTASATSTNSPAPNFRSRMIEADYAEKQLPAKDNAATDYRKAFALVEKLTREEKKAMRYSDLAKSELSADEIEALLIKIEPIIALLRQGATQPSCDWGMRSLAALTKTTHMYKAWELGQIAFWDAKQRVHDQPKNSTADIQAIYNLGSTINSGAGSSLTHLAFSGFVSEFIKDFASEIPQESRQQLLSMLIQPDFLKVAQVCNRSEIDINLQLLDLLKSGVDFDGGPLSELVKNTAASMYGNDAATQERTTKGLKRLAAIADESIFWPDEKFNQWCQQVADMPVLEDGSSPLQSFVGIRNDLRNALRQRNMTAAGLVFMDEGEAALPSYFDPFNGEMFSYKVVDANGSFELQSTVVNKGKPVTMTFKMPAR